MNPQKFSFYILCTSVAARGNVGLTCTVTIQVRTHYSEFDSNLKGNKLTIVSIHTVRQEFGFSFCSRVSALAFKMTDRRRHFSSRYYTHQCSDIMQLLKKTF